MRHVKAYMLVTAVLMTLALQAQVGINTTTPDASAALDISAIDDKGVLIPRVALTSVDELAPITDPDSSNPEALLVYNTNTTLGKGFYYWSGNQWVRLLFEGDAKNYDSPWKDFDNNNVADDVNDNLEGNGDVIIGTNKSLGAFTMLTEDGESASATLLRSENSGTSGFDIDLQKIPGFYTLGVLTLPNRVQNDDVLGRVMFKSVRAIDATTGEPLFGENAYIQGVVDGAVGPDDAPGRLEFYTTPAGSTTAQRSMVIYNNGQIRFERWQNWETQTANVNDANFKDKLVGINRTWNNMDFVLTEESAITTNRYTMNSRSQNGLEIRDNDYGVDLMNMQKMASIKPVGTHNPNFLTVGSYWEFKDADVLKTKGKATPAVTLVSTIDDLSPMMLEGLPVFDSNDAAKTAGLELGMVYKDKEGTLMIVF